ncbi:MAG: cell division protein ZapE [Paracoccaceae bacterium]
MTVQQAYDQAVTAGELTPDPAQLSALPVLDTLRSELDARAKTGGLRRLFAKRNTPIMGCYLWGGVGRGKSMLMDLFVEQVSSPKRRVHFHAFMQEIHGALHEARKTQVDDALRPVAKAISDKVCMLALDEMQISDITDAMIVGRLFELLMADGVVVVTTSNRVPDDLYLNGLNRDLFLPFIALLKERLVVHELISETDHRQGKLTGQKTYFSPANAAAQTVIERLWQGFSGGLEHPLVLRVKGRETVLRRFHNGVARTIFWDLCGAALGAGDYLALAGAVRVLILEDVPLLGRNNYNEAKRFVMLIDTLYEENVQVIISAADVPERLYLEGSGSFEFERTVSRLYEMQSDGWGGEKNIR